MTAEPTVDIHPAIDTALVRRLVETQFPQGAGLPLKRLERAGSDHVIHRLGEELSVRLPRHRGAAGQARKESTWLRRLAPGLPLAVPVPMGVGEPAFGHPWPWAVPAGWTVRWRTWRTRVDAAVELAVFLVALQRIPPAEDREGLTAESLADRDGATRAAIAEVDGTFDAVAMTELWEAALDAPGWDRPPGLVPR